MRFEARTLRWLPSQEPPRSTNELSIIPRTRPFPHIARHIQCAYPTHPFRITAYRSGILIAIINGLVFPTIRAIHITKIELCPIKFISPRINVPFFSSSRIFPLLFRRQFCPHPVRIILRIVPRNTYDGVIRTIKIVIIGTEMVHKPCRLHTVDIGRWSLRIYLSNNHTLSVSAFKPLDIWITHSPTQMVVRYCPS